MVKRWRRFVLPVIGTLAVLGLSPPAAATHNADQHSKMELEFTSLNPRTNSDLAFWGDYAVHGYYGPDSAPSGGVRLFDISNPDSPVLLRDFACDGQQNDPILWDRNGNGVPDLLLLAVDRTMAAPACGAPRTVNHGDPAGWEGVRVFTLSDDPAAPFTTITQVAAVYTDCGAHTITLWPGEIEDTGNLIVYVSSYPLRAGPTCGDTEFANLANPFDEDPGSPANPLHGVIQVVEVPLANPAGANEMAVQPPISYPGDPDGRIEWGERNPALVPPAFEPGAVACHDIVADVPAGLAAGACAEQGQIWEIDANGIPDTANPLVVDDEVSSGGSGNIPGAVDFFHSAMFNNDATVANWVDESFGAGCPTMTTWQPRPWNPAGGTHKTGRMFFSDVQTGDFLSEFHVGDLRPDTSSGSYCSAHMGMSVTGTNRDLLVNAWYTGGVDVIDFTQPTKLKEVAYYDIANVTNARSGSDNWSAYPYTGPAFPNGPGIPVYATDGLGGPFGRGMVVFRTLIHQPGSNTIDHLNPQTMD